VTGNTVIGGRQQGGGSEEGAAKAEVGDAAKSKGMVLIAKLVLS
jgi:hypothetical protein